MKSSISKKKNCLQINSKWNHKDTTSASVFAGFDNLLIQGQIPYFKKLNSKQPLLHTTSACIQLTIGPVDPTLLKQC